MRAPRRPRSGRSGSTSRRPRPSSRSRPSSGSSAPTASIRHVRIQGQPLAVDGELDGFTGTTARHHREVEAEEAPERSENRYQKLIAKAPVGQAVYSLDLHLVEVNEAGGRPGGRHPRGADRAAGRRPALRARTGRWSARWPTSAPVGSPRSRSSTSSMGRDGETDLGDQHRHRRARRRRQRPALPLADPRHHRAQAGRGPAPRQRGPLPQADRRGPGGPADRAGSTASWSRSTRPSST